MIAKRHLVVASTFFLSVLLYVDRTCITTAKDAISAELGLNNEQWAWVLASFAFGYSLFQTPGGALADRLGARVVLAAVVTAWSLFTGLTAAAWSFGSLLLIRFLFGAGEAGAFPGMARVVYSWIPVSERGLVKGINFSGARLGAALAMPAVASMIQWLGWKPTFAVLMGIGIVWAAGWWWCFRDDPRELASVSPEELSLIETTRQPQSAVTRPLGFSQLLGSRSLWFMMVQYFASNFTFFFSLTWLYPYVKTTYKLGEVAAGWYAMVPLLGGAAGNIFSGWLVDRLYRAGHHSLSRKLPAIIGFTLAAVGMLNSLGQETVGPAICWLTVAVFGADMTLSPSWSFCIDIGGRHAGEVSGTMNMAGNLGSAITSLAFFYLSQDDKGSHAFFYTAAGLSGGAILCWLLADNRHSISPS